MIFQMVKKKLEIFKFDTLFNIAFSQWNLINLGVEVHPEMPEAM